jgi:Predicted ATP-binding protein involved in virulence
MEHFIRRIHIEKLRHLENIKIEISETSRRHLLITGKNGSGKTSLLEALSKCLTVANDFKTDIEEIFNGEKSFSELTDSGVTISLNSAVALHKLFRKGEFVMAYFPATRQANIVSATGVEDVKFASNYELTADPAEKLAKYMVHLKTQQAYARQENDSSIEKNIQSWFNRFEKALRALFEDESLTMTYDYRNYNFLIHQDGRNPFGFNELSDGYSSVIQIVMGLIMRMEQNWLLKGTLSEYDIEGIALIDELETHLHIELQQKFLPFLVTFFPRVQFIVSTHSPYVLTSISEATIFDLEKKVSYEDMSLYSVSDVAEGYFDAEDYSGELMNKLIRYRNLVSLTNPSESERAERAELRMTLKNMQGSLAERVKEEFEDLELQRRNG